MKQLAKGSQDPNIVKEVYGTTRPVAIMRLSILIGFLLLASFAFSQAGMVQSVASIGESGGLVKVIPFAPVVVCGYPAVTSSPPCSNLTTTYTTPTKAGTCSSSAQVIWPGTSTCKSTADASGNFAFFADTGQNATYYFKYLSVWFGPFAVVVGGGGGGTPGGINGQLQFNNLGAFGGVTTATPIINLFTGCSGVLYLGADGACHVIGAAPWNSILAPTGNASLSMGANTTLFSFGDFGASPSSAIYGFTDSATTTTDTSVNVLFNTGPSSRHNAIAIQQQNVNQFQVCWQPGPQSQIVIGSAVACSAINQTPFSKFVVESTTAAHTINRLYQKSIAATGTMLEMNNATAASSAFNFFTACASASTTDTSCASFLAQLRGDGFFLIQSLKIAGITGATSQCLHVDTVGNVSGTGSDCGAGGGGGLSGQTALGVPVAATPTTSTSSTIPGTNRGVYLIGRTNTVQGTATSPTEIQVGDCAAPGAISGATTTYTLAYTDVVGCVVAHDRAASGSATITIPTPTTLNNSAPYFFYANYSAQSDTLTPTTYTISQGTAAAAATLAVPSGFACKVNLDPVNAVTWKAGCYQMTTSAAAGGSVNVNGSPVTSANFNGTTPAAGAGNINGTFQVSASNVSVEVPTPLVNGTAASTTALNLNSTTPAAGAGFQNATIQQSGNNVSAQVPIVTTPLLWIPYSNTGTIQATATAVTGAGVNVVACKQFIPPTQITFTHITVNISTTSAGQSVNIGIYDNSLNRLIDSGAISTTASGAQSATVASTTLLAGGTYYECAAFTDTVAALTGSGATSGFSNLANKNATREFTCANSLAAGALPATCGVQTVASTKSYLAIIE